MIGYLLSSLARCSVNVWVPLRFALLNELDHKALQIQDCEIFQVGWFFLCPWWYLSWDHLQSLPLVTICGDITLEVYVFFLGLNDFCCCNGAYIVCHRLIRYARPEISDYVVFTTQVRNVDSELVDKFYPASLSIWWFFHCILVGEWLVVCSEFCTRAL